MTEYEEEEMYLYLDFKGRLPVETFNTEVFFNVVNLDTKHPLVQLGQSVFYGRYQYQLHNFALITYTIGTYEDCVGTNLFFEEDEHSTENEQLLIKTPIKLQYVTKQFKVLNMQWAKLPEDATGEVTDDYDLQFKEDYDVILKKIEKGALKIEDVQLRQREDIEPEPNKAQQTESVKPVQPVVRAKQKKKTKPQQVDVIVEKYTKLDSLKQLAREPLKRQIAAEPCEIPNSLKASYVYNSFKNKLLQENFYFDSLVVNYNQSTLEGAVDINRCLRKGLIKLTGDHHLDINTDTKTALLSLQNFENLSLPMRYCVLRSQMKKQKRYIKSATEKEIQQVTELGVNVRDSYKILKVLAGDIKKRIFCKQTLFEGLKECSEDGGKVMEKGGGGGGSDEERSVESMSQ